MMEQMGTPPIGGQSIEQRKLEPRLSLQEADGKVKKDVIATEEIFKEAIV
jgi:hypothetical protein